MSALDYIIRRSICAILSPAFSVRGISLKTPSLPRRHSSSVPATPAKPSTRRTLCRCPRSMPVSGLSRKPSLVLLSYPEKNFGEAKVLRLFISTHTELTAQGILNIYAKRWNIEVFFRSCKQKLAFDKYQLRKKQGITRMWLILSLIHFLCCTVSGCVGSFDEGYNYFRNCVLQEIFAPNAFSA